MRLTSWAILIFFHINYFLHLFLQASAVNIIVGSHVWVEDPALAWIDGEVKRIDGQDLHIQTTNGKKVSTNY